MTPRQYEFLLDYDRLRFSIHAASAILCRDGQYIKPGRQGVGEMMEAPIRVDCRNLLSVDHDPGIRLPLSPDFDEVPVLDEGINQDRGAVVFGFGQFRRFRK